MYQNIMLAGLAVVTGLVVLRVYQSWQAEKARKPAARSKAKASSRRRAGSDTADQPTEPFHCVTLVGDCSALDSYKGKRFLARTAPPLPVPGCSAGRCDCHYTHHADRRKPKDDRRALGRLAEEQYVLVGNDERRKSKGRRKSDVGWASIDDWNKAV